MKFKSLLVNSISIFFILLFACNSSKNNKSNKITSKSISNHTKYNDSLFNSGIDFNADGISLTNWNISINFEDSIYFKANDGSSFTIACNKSNIQKTNTDLVITTKLKGEKIKIVYTNFICNKNNISNTTVDYKNKSYIGCGNYLKNATLNNKWILYKVRNNFVENYSKIPELTFDVDKNKITGNDGCNNVNASVRIEGDKIYFGPFISTKMYCPPTEFSTLLEKQIDNQIANYYFKNNMLYLYLIDDSILIFKKAN